MAPGTPGFTFVLSMAMAVTALSIDTVLPAFPEIREYLDLPADSTSVAALVTAFLIGSGLGLIPAGLLADRYGRRPVMWGGLLIFSIGAAAAALAPTLELMLAARVLWGLGAAGPRVAALAMVRDAYEGEQMARQMSLIMAVFILVPTVAPAIGAGLLAIGPWQLVFWLCALAGVAVFALSTRLPATMPPGERRALTANEILASWRVVLTTPGTLAYLVALTALFASFISYLASSEIIYDEVFGLADWFPVIFGALALLIGAMMLINGRLVERVGLERMINRLLVLQLGASAALVALALLTDGTPPFWAFIGAFSIVAGVQTVLTPNLNSAAMRPLAHVAGSGAALLGMIPMIIGSLLGSLIDRAYNGTITPMSIGFLVAGSVAMIASRAVPAVRART
jgi:DHA1 family bicyclomycin/chloramphenicol resistance-like MFS transporter